MKKCILLLLTALMVLIAAGTMAEGEEWSSVELTRLMGNGTNLGNTMEACNSGKLFGRTTDDPAYYETMWGQPVTTREMIHGLKEAGFDTLRIPVAWMTNATYLGQQGDYTISPAYLDRVEEIVSWALDEGMFVILNDHWDGGWYGMFGSESPETRALAMEAYCGMWTQIAVRFEPYDHHLIFEGANEEIGARFDENSPLYCQDSTVSYLTESERYALALRVNQAFVDTVRATGGSNADRFLLIPGYGTNIENTCKTAFVMPKDTVADRLLISVHCYTPWSYCNPDASAATATPWGTKSHFAELEQELKMMTKFTAQGIGVVIGEYGALPGSDGQMKTNAVTYHRYFLDLCDYYDYCPVLWDTSGFYVRRDLSFSDPEMAALYLERRQAAEGDRAAVKEQARASMEAAVEAAPESFRQDIMNVDEGDCVAWIMWSSGDWSVSYSVGDTYAPDAMTPGLIPTDARIEGEGTYTVALDFTGTQAGYSSNVAFTALGIANGELLHPGWAVHIQEVRINGEAVKLSGRPYTTSDDRKCTRVNLFNEWVTQVPSDARTYYGPVSIGASPTVLDRSDAAMGQVKTIEVTFIYGPKK